MNNEQGSTIMDDDTVSRSSFPVEQPAFNQKPGKALIGGLDLWYYQCKSSKLYLLLGIQAAYYGGI